MDPFGSVGLLGLCGVGLCPTDSVRSAQIGIWGVWGLCDHLRRVSEPIPSNFQGVTGQSFFFFVAFCDLHDPCTITIASALSGPELLLSSSPSQVKWRQMILAWITKLEITFQLPGDTLIKNPVAGSTQQ